MGKVGTQVPTAKRRDSLIEFVRLFRSVIDPYRPELHYMRGPGPKWRAKHTARLTEAPEIPGLARIEG